MRVIYDAASGRVLALGDAVEAGAGQAVAEVTPDESGALALAQGEADAARERHREATVALERATDAYLAAAEAVKAAFVAADAAARKAGGAVIWDGAGFATGAGAAPTPEPTPEEDEALVASEPKLSALVRLLERKYGATEREAIASPK